MKYSSKALGLSACFAIISLGLAASPATAQSYSTPQGTPQAYQSAPCYSCPFPQGNCAFPQGFCPLPSYPCGTPMASPQGTTTSPQMTPQYSYTGYQPKYYPAPTFFTPRPIGIPTASIPSAQSYAEPSLQLSPN